MTWGQGAVDELTKFAPHGGVVLVAMAIMYAFLKRQEQHDLRMDAIAERYMKQLRVISKRQDERLNLIATRFLAESAQMRQDFLERMFGPRTEAHHPQLPRPDHEES